MRARAALDAGRVHEKRDVRPRTHRDRETTVRPRHPADWHKVDWRSRLNAGLAGALDYLEVHGIGTALGEPN